VSGWKKHREGGGGGEGAPRLDLLIVDDEEKILESLTEIFKDRYEVVTAGNPEEALKVFSERRPQLVLCDQRMPGKTGIAVNDQILHRYVTKPWENEDLVSIVDQMAARYLEENGFTGGDERILF
jgi:two-component system response regulator HupR/HoxA